MMSFFRLRSHPVPALLCALTIVSGLGMFRAQADEWNKKTILTVNEPIQVTDTVLNPGQYVFMLADSNSDRHIVRIYNADQTHLINTVMAVPDYRIQPTGNSRFAFWETPPGTAKALRAWFYPGDNFGQEFTYPKHPYTLQAKVTTPTETVARTEPAPAPEQSPSVAPPPEPAGNQPAPEQSQPEPQPEIAQNTPPPAAAQPAPAPSTQPQQPSKPEELPQTASPYPMIGLGGGLLLGLAGLLRLKRLA